jgi:hypothetical protein
MALDRGIVDQQLQALGEGTSWWNQRELRDLPTILDADEHILAIARGKIARVRWLRRSWLIVVTETRLLCVRSSGRSWRQIEVGADQISRVSMRVGPFRARVVFSAGAERYRLLVTRSAAYKLTSALATFDTTSRNTMPGFAPARVVRRVVDHVLALPAAALDPAPKPAPRAQIESGASDVKQRLDALEEEVNHLREQVDFLEQLLRQRQAV